MLLESAAALVNWMNFHTEKSILPTTHPPGGQIQQPVRRSSTGSAIITWIRRSISSASETLDVVGTPGNSDADKNNNETSPERSKGQTVSQASSFSSVAPVNFPAFLNDNGYAASKRFNYRRASLLDGMEQTLQISLNRRAVLVPPLSETKRKLNIAFKNLLLASPKPRTPMLGLGEEGESQSLLPVPIYLPVNKAPNPQRSLLSLAEVKKNLDSATRSSAIEAYSRSKTVQSLFYLSIIFLASCAMIGVVYNNFPKMLDEERAKVRLPKDIEDAKSLGRVLSKYKDTHYYEVMSAFFVTYIFLQTFAIPGSVFLSILSGFMYPFYIALFLVCTCSGIGATGCYLISLFVGKPLVHKYLEERVRKWNEVVDGQREHLFNYLLFLRITPFLPNWFINIVSPVIEIPISTFFIATFLGVAPLSFIAIQAGTTLYQLTTAGDALSWTGIGIMGILAVLSLLPVVLKSKLKGKFE